MKTYEELVEQERKYPGSVSGVRVETPVCPKCSCTRVRPTPGSHVVKCAACGHNWNPQR